MAENITLENVRLLYIIDDDPVQTEMIKDYVSERYIFTLKTYEDGESAMTDIETNKPEIIILDYHLSSSNPQAKNGIEILKEIKKNKPRYQSNYVLRSRQYKYCIGEYEKRCL